jgi:hypothetical protein
MADSSSPAACSRGLARAEGGTQRGNRANAIGDSDQPVAWGAARDNVVRDRLTWHDRQNPSTIVAQHRQVDVAPTLEP